MPPDDPTDRNTRLVGLARELVNGACPLPDVVTGGQPTAELLARAAAAGARTVLDLRGEDERRDFDEGEEVRRRGMEYVNIPVAYDALGTEEFDRFRALMQDAERRPVLVHCASANRVGALLLPYLVLDEGRDREEAFELACAVGLRHPGIAEAAFRYLDERGT